MKGETEMTTTTETFTASINTTEYAVRASLCVLIVDRHQAALTACALIGSTHARSQLAITGEMQARPARAADVVEIHRKNPASVSRHRSRALPFLLATRSLAPAKKKARSLSTPTDADARFTCMMPISARQSRPNGVYIAHARQGERTVAGTVRIRCQ